MSLVLRFNDFSYSLVCGMMCLSVSILLLYMDRVTFHQQGCILKYIRLEYTMYLIRKNRDNPDDNRHIELNEDVYKLVLHTPPPPCDSYYRRKIIKCNGCK